MTERRAGFTLIEVVVTLLIAGIAVLLAGRIFSAAEAGVRAVRASRTELDRRANAHRWLASVFLSLEVGTDLQHDGGRGEGGAGETDRARPAWERASVARVGVSVAGGRDDWIDSL